MLSVARRAVPQSKVILKVSFTLSQDFTSNVSFLNSIYRAAALNNLHWYHWAQEHGHYQRTTVFPSAGALRKSRFLTRKERQCFRTTHWCLITCVPCWHPRDHCWIHEFILCLYIMSYIHQIFSTAPSIFHAFFARSFHILRTSLLRPTWTDRWTDRGSMPLDCNALASVLFLPAIFDPRAPISPWDMDPWRVLLVYGHRGAWLEYFSRPFTSRSISTFLVRRS